MEIKVPDIGDFKDVEVIEVLVATGQKIKKNDPLITIESDKSSVEIPSIFDGKIKSVKTKIGDKVSEGDLILILENVTKEKEKTEEDLKIENETKENGLINLTVDKKSIDQSKLKNSAPASPKARKFARELGVDINQVTGSEKDGRVVEDDIKKFISSKSKNIDKLNESKKVKVKNEFEHSDFGEVEIKEIPRVKKLASTYLVNSWTNIPHVTNHDEADITEMESFRNSLTDLYTGEKIKITPLAFIIKALAVSLKKFPNFNSSIDEIETGKMTLKRYYHIGVAVDTPNGLMVPKLRNVNSKKISIIGNELKEISKLCRNLKISKKELFGGSMTITSLGGIGGSFFTPIINYPEVAILGIGRSQKKQIYIDGKFETRVILPLSLSYDHRIIDGAEAARFNNELKENLGKNFAYKLAV
ncbi:MAG: dihydrolipoamide acetyltransferase [Pelagibacterales bacterium MED-G42]|nr:MAG: dihydrolipoamide acetyltransferase [Pelagibacterales bacterium MED-G42]